MKDTLSPKSRIQTRNRRLILDAALDSFAQHGFRGTTLDQIAKAAGLSKPNLLYYFSGKEDIHRTLLNQLMDNWLDPLRDIDETGEPLEVILAYVHHKLDMARDMPRESRLFATEILQGAPQITGDLETGLRPLFQEKCALISRWVREGRLAPCEPAHLIFSIWATTQHYSDFDAQVRLLLQGEDFGGARAHLDTLFRTLLTPRNSNNSNDPG